MNADKLEAFVDVYRLLKNPEIDGSDVSGTLLLDVDACSKLTQLSHHEDIYSGQYTFEGKTFGNYNDCIGQAVSITVTVNNSFFYKDLNHFLNIGSNKTTEPEAYYISGLNYFYPKDNPCSQIENYHNYLKFIEFLETIADHSNNMDLIFLSREKLRIPINYDGQQLFNLNNLDALLNDFKPSEKDLEQKKIILKRVLVNMLKNIDEKLRFAELCQKFGTMLSRYRDNYFLFLEDIDMDEIINEATKRKVDYLTQISKVYSDMQGKLLTIPIALVPVVKTSKDCLSNFAILVGVLIYILLMCLYIRNQWKSISEIQADKDKYYNRLVEKFSQNDELKNLFEGVDSKFKSMSCIINVLYGILILTILFNVVFLIYLPHFA